MNPLKASELFGNWATLLIPVNDDESINYQILAEEIDILIESEVNGIYSNGTAGEFYNQTEDEFDKVSAILAEKCNKYNMPFQIGISHMSPIISKERLLRAKQYKPSAFQVILPDWFPTTKDEDVVFLKKMAELADNIGLVIYNPPHAKKKLTPDWYEFIKKEIPQVIGVKTSGGNDFWYNEMREKCPELSIFIPGHNLATGIKNGAHGSYSNISCLSPVMAQRWYELTQTDMDKALDIESKIITFMNTYIRPLINEHKYSNQSIDKFMAVLGGWSVIPAKLRWPYCSVPDSFVTKTKGAAQELVFDSYK